MIAKLKFKRRNNRKKQPNIICNCQFDDVGIHVTNIIMIIFTCAFLFVTSGTRYIDLHFNLLDWTALQGVLIEFLWFVYSILIMLNRHVVTHCFEGYSTHCPKMVREYFQSYDLAKLYSA